MGCGSKWPWEGFPHPQIGEINSVSQLSKALEQNSQNMLHLGEPGVASGGRSPSLATEGVVGLGAASLYCFPSPRCKWKKGKSWKQRSHPVSPTLALPNPINCVNNSEKKFKK